MKVCIGIISYMPEGNLRKIRFRRLKELISKCNQMFKLPILIVAQNWGDDVVLNNDNVEVFKYDQKLGITEARRQLRRHFLSSQYDYIIMLDDDAQLVGTMPDVRRYLEEIENHPGMFGVYKTFLLKLFAISKEMYQLIDFPEGDAENGDFFEDMYLIMALEKLYPEKKFIFKRTTLNDISNSASDPDSTWFKKQFNKHDIGDRTRAMIRELKNENISK